MGYLCRSQLTNPDLSGELVRISVSQEHIDRARACFFEVDGKKHLYDTECPVAWAIRDQINDFRKNGEKVGVRSDAVVCYGGAPRFQLGEDVERWIAAFHDADETNVWPGPFDFQIGSTYLRYAAGSNQ
jgi:hypothetical protein